MREELGGAVPRKRSLEAVADMTTMCAVSSFGFFPSQMEVDSGTNGLSPSVGRGRLL
jgi:hypothetical protein